MLLGGFPSPASVLTGVECWLETGDRALWIIGESGERGDLRSSDLYLENN